MITARELAEEIGAPVNDVMTALNDIHELTLSPDSVVRDIAADVIRERFRRIPQVAQPQDNSPQLAADEQLERLRRVLAGEEPPAPRAPTIDLTPPSPRVTTKKPRGWRPGDPPLPKVVKTLADRIVQHSNVRRRPPGVIFGDELADARGQSDVWMKQRIKQGVFISDDDIVKWIVAFPDDTLRPEEVFAMWAAGLTPQDIRLRLWYGRVHNGRLTLLQQIRRGDLSIEKAAADVAEFKRRQSAG